MFAFIVSDRILVCNDTFAQQRFAYPTNWLTGIVFGQYRVSAGVAAAGAVGLAIPVFLLF